MDLLKLRNSPYVKEKEFGHISSFNFARDAFRSGIWDDITTKARGLFLDNRTGNVVARAYNKFFNVEECRETSLKSLKENLRFPVRAYRKENGFLGILSMDPVSGNLLYCTKSMVGGGPYNRIFRNVCRIVSERDAVNFSVFEKTIAAFHVSLVFEVIDPVNDPHIIEYREPQLYLLDAVYNTDNFKTMSYESLCAIAAGAGVPYKKLAHIYTSWDELENELQKIKSTEYRYNGEYIEGFVMQDASGFMFKAKTGYYKQWKRFRTALANMLKNKGEILHPERYTPEELSVLQLFSVHIQEKQSVDPYLQRNLN